MWLLHRMYDFDVIWYDMIYLLNSIGLTPGGRSTVHIYTQTIYRIKKSTQTMHRRTQLTNWEKCGPCPLFASYTVAFVFVMLRILEQISVKCCNLIQLPCINQIQSTWITNNCNSIFIMYYIHNVLKQLTKLIRNINPYRTNVENRVSS